MIVAARADETAIPKELFLGMLAGLRQLDVDVEAVLRELGSSVADLPNLPERIAPEIMTRVWEAVVEQTGEDGFGLRIAQLSRPGNFDVFGNIVATSATLGDALARTLRYHRLVAETVRFSLELTEGRAVLVLERLHPTPIHPEAAEFLLGSLVSFSRRLTDADGSPLEVYFAHDRRRNVEHVERFFRAPIRYGARSSSLVFDSRALSQPVVGYDPERSAELVREAEALLADSSQVGGIQRDIVEAITAEIGTGDLTVERVAARLDLHPKALSRRLSAEGTSYQKLVDDVRLRLASRYLEKSELSVTEIAFRLGYSEKSAFNRAFKRWTGESPEAFRER